MSTDVPADAALEHPEVSTALQRLEQGARTLPSTALEQRIKLADQILGNIVRRSHDWVSACCRAKGIESPAGRSEEILAGPVTTARYVTILKQSLQQIARNGRPQIPGQVRRRSDGRLSVPVFPAKGVYDPIVFLGLRAEVRMQPDIGPDEIHGDRLSSLMDPPETSPITLVLGAGNVSSIPPTDVMSKLFQQGECVLLKMSPVNDYLTDIFRDVFAPVIDCGWLQIITGDASVGRAALASAAITGVHMTGSHHTHDAIVWGETEEERHRRKLADDPRLTRPITSELGNVSPWIFVPATYSAAELDTQATNVAASMTNNAAFNCLTTRVIVTWRQWAQRDDFLAKLQSVLAGIPPRVAYYPGAHERYEQFTGTAPAESADGTLPWTLLTDVNPDESPRLFEDESFVCVACEVALDAESPQAFLEVAAEFCNDRLFGTLCASITLPERFHRQEAPLVDRVINRLNYGSVCLNQFAGLVYGLMTPPWGGAPGNSLSDVQSGIGDVHNLYFLDNFEKTVLYGPVRNFPKPIWFPSHRRAEQVARKLIDFYSDPTLTKLPGILLPAALG